MNLEYLARNIDAKVFSRGRPMNVEINRIYAGDRISDLLSQAPHRTLLVTNLASAQIMRVAQLMDISGICLLNNITPEPEIIQIALEHQTLLMVSPLGMFETCGRLYQTIIEESLTGL
ncbi:MAG: hypothetical protein WC975_10210 [Phycisphaerae bacterium]